MARSIERIHQTITEARPWAIAACVVGAALLLYFAGQGVRYWLSADNIGSLEARIDTLRRATGPASPEVAQEEATLQATQLRVEGLNEMFHYPATDELMGILSATAGETGLDLVSITADDPELRDIDSLRYQVRPISIIVDGPPDNVRQFLARIHQRVPVVVASSAQMVNLDTSPSTQMVLDFYLSPEPVPVEETDAGVPAGTAK